MRFHARFMVLFLVLLIIFGFNACSGGTFMQKSNSFKVKPAYIQKSEKHLSIDAQYPILKGFTKAAELNAIIEDRLSAAVSEAESAAEGLEGREGFSASLNSNYQFFTNDQIVSLWINYDNFLGGAHGLYWIDSYTFNFDSGQIYNFPDLFLGNEGIDYATGIILQQIDSEKSNYFDDANETVLGYEGKYNFLINGNELVAYFPLYDIAPYVAGIQYFTFTSDELQGLLKPEIINAMEGQMRQDIMFMQR
jgi:hypothetical protein